DLAALAFVAVLAGLPFALDLAALAFVPVLAGLPFTEEALAVLTLVKPLALATSMMAVSAEALGGAFAAAALVAAGLMTGNG
ncbi:MAG: hypothetical protein AB8A46_03115, partial [Prochlorococcus sp.]